MDLRSCIERGGYKPFAMIRRTSGFSILEVLIALAIFALAAVVLGASYLNVLTGYEVANRVLQRNDDVRFARDALLAEADPEVVVKGGNFDGGNNRRVQWKAKLDPTETTDVFLVTFECEITAPELRKPERVVETFRVLRPTWSKADERSKIQKKNADRITKILQTLKS